MFQTYKTKIKNQKIALLTNESNQETVELYEYFEQFASFFGRLERKLFVDLYVRKKKANPLKVAYCSTYNITSRQFNSIKSQLDGRVKSKIELQKLYIEETKQKIKQLDLLIQTKEVDKLLLHEKILSLKGNEKSFLKIVDRYRKLRGFIHQKKRKLHRMNEKLIKLTRDANEGRVRLCFGSKTVFHKQFHLKENGLTFGEWKKLWQQRRSAQFNFIGSKDETFGNQTCTYDKENTLSLRVNKEDEHRYGKKIAIPNVVFTYGQENINKGKESYIGYTKGKSVPTKYFKALTHRFVFEKSAWYLLTSIEVEDSKIQTMDGNGMIGVDFNANFIAVADIDRNGNYLKTFNVPFKAYGVSSERAKQSLSIALKTVTEYALEKGKPLSREELDFKKKKLQLKEFSKKQARMLSGLNYATYKEMLDGKCRKLGVELRKVNPAYTSQIGHHKFMRRYGISSHESAAIAIARRAMYFKNEEKVPKKHILKDKEKVLRKKRADQWKEITKQWKKHSPIFKHRMYVLQRAM